MRSHREADRRVKLKLYIYFIILKGLWLFKHPAPTTDHLDIVGFVKDPSFRNCAVSYLFYLEMHLKKKRKSP